MTKSTKKINKFRPYPPDFVRLSTLAYRLDLSDRTVQDYVSSGILPEPVMCGNIKLWQWNSVEQFLAKSAENLNDGHDGDEYALGLENATKKEANGRSA